MNPAVLLLILRVLLALLLYAFLGFLMILLWRDLRRRSRAEEELPQAHLFVEEGLDPAKVFRLAGSNILGRSAENDVSLPDDTVSARHASIAYRDGQWWLEDLGSANGTLLNGARIEQALVISSGDKITLGRVRLVFRDGLPRPEGPTPDVSL
jgi:hypothetical protein